jgi:hypothetical protein
LGRSVFRFGADFRVGGLLVVLGLAVDFLTAVFEPVFRLVVVFLAVVLVFAVDLCVFVFVLAGGFGFSSPKSIVI